VSDIQQLLAETCRITTAAGELIETIRTEGFKAATKGDMSPVTRADREADALLRGRLLRLAPVGWLSEETADDPARLSRDRLWVVDPLDGTKEFVKGIPEYSVAVALVENGEPLLGVVHNPATGDTFSAARGAGAFRNGRPIRCVEGKTALASRSETARGEFSPFVDSWDVRSVGSIQLKLALVAAGDAAVTFSRGPKHEWDVCAGALIVAEAGGLATDVYGDPLRYNQAFPKVKGILAGARAAYARALRQIGAIGASERMDELADTRGAP
jgi:myo-inositol-1(or 4)-monophosphatase